MNRIFTIMLVVVLSGCSTAKHSKSSLIENVHVSVLNEQYLINKYLKNKKLDNIEGIWMVKQKRSSPHNVMIIKNPNKSESEYLGIVSKGHYEIISKGHYEDRRCEKDLKKERKNNCDVRIGDRFLAFNKSNIRSDSKNVYYGVRYFIRGSCLVCGQAEAAYSRFKFSPNGPRMVVDDYVDTSTLTETHTFEDLIVHIHKPRIKKGPMVLGYKEKYYTNRFYPNRRHYMAKIYPQYKPPKPTNKFKYKNPNPNMEEKIDTILDEAQKPLEKPIDKLEKSENDASTEDSTNTFGEFINSTNKFVLFMLSSLLAFIIFLIYSRNK